MLKDVILSSKQNIQKQLNYFTYLLENCSDSNNLFVYQNAVYSLEQVIKSLEEIENIPSRAGRKKKVDVDEIKRLRKEGRTQQEVATILNISISTVKRNE